MRVGESEAEIYVYANENGNENGRERKGQCNGSRREGRWYVCMYAKQNGDVVCTTNANANADANGDKQANMGECTSEQ